MWLYIHLIRLSARFLRAEIHLLLEEKALSVSALKVCCRSRADVGIRPYDTTYSVCVGDGLPVPFYAVCGRGNPAPTVTFEVGTHPRLPCLKGGGKTVGFDGGIVCGRPMVAPTMAFVVCANRSLYKKRPRGNPRGRFT